MVQGVVGGTETPWAHNGRELFYVNGNQELVVVEVDTEPSFAPGPESVLFSVAEYRSWNLNHSYSVAHDDLRFVYLKNVAVGIHETMRVLNFFEELKATVGNWAGPWGSGVVDYTRNRVVN